MWTAGIAGRADRAAHRRAGHRLQPLRCLLLFATLTATTVTSSAQSIGNTTERLELCATFQPPTSYEDTAFLGERLSLEAGGVNFSYLQFGPLLNNAEVGVPLVLIAGQGATASVWTPDLLRGLAQGREVIIFDNMGIGLSTTSNTDFSTQGYVDSTLAFVEALSLGQPPDLLGWSMGGEIAITAAEGHPDAFRRLIFVDTGPGGPAAASTPASQAVAPQVLEYISTGVPLPAPYIFPDTDEGNEAMCRFLSWIEAGDDQPTQQQTVRQGPALIDYAATASPVIYDDLGNITNSVLVVQGTQDLIYPLGDALSLIQWIPGASLLQYVDAGHAAILQHENASATIISAFLDADPGLPPYAGQSSL